MDNLFIRKLTVTRMNKILNTVKTPYLHSIMIHNGINGKLKESEQKVSQSHLKKIYAISISIPSNRFWLENILYTDHHVKKIEKFSSEYNF